MSETEGTTGEVGMRAYRRSDLAAMVALDRLCFAEQFVFSAAAMRRFAEARGAYAVVAERRDVLVGFVIGQMEQEKHGRVGYCVTLDVAPGERRTGLGRRLLERVEAWARDGGAREMALHVYAGNGGAQRFYAAGGYREVGREAGFYGPGLDAVLCRKELRKD